MFLSIILFIIFQAISFFRRYFLMSNSLIVIDIIFSLLETVFGILFLTNCINLFIKNNHLIKKILNIFIVIISLIFFTIYNFLLFNKGA